MQVSSVCAGMFSAVESGEPVKVNSANKNNDTVSTFTSTPKQYEFMPDMDGIYEWKCFCQQQIMANNIDYIV